MMIKTLTEVLVATVVQSQLPQAAQLIFQINQFMPWVVRVATVVMMLVTMRMTAPTAPHQSPTLVVSPTQTSTSQLSLIFQ